MEPDRQLEKLFFADYNKVSNQLRAYIRQLLPTRQDAEEVLQETSIVLWSKYENFEQGTNFFAWAYKTAYFEVLKYRRTKARDRLVFSDEVFEQLAQKTEDSIDSYDKRKAALQNCFTKLSREYRELLMAVYFKNETIKAVAERTNTSPKVMYRLLTKIRGQLKQCIEGS